MPTLARAAPALILLFAPMAAHAQEAAPAAPEVRWTETIAARRGEPVTTRDLATLVDFDSIALSPDRRRVATMVWQGDPDRNDYRVGWRIVDLAGTAPPIEAEAGPLLQPRPVEDAQWGGNITGERAAWSSDGRWLYHRRRAGEDIQVWRTRADGVATEQVTNDAGRVTGFRLEADGRLVFAVEPSAAAQREALRQEGLGGYRFDDERFILNFSHAPVIGRRAQDGLAGRVSIEPAIKVLEAGGGVRAASEEERNAYYGAVGASPMRPQPVSRGAVEVSARVLDPETNRGPLPPLIVQARIEGGALDCARPECRGKIRDLGLSDDGAELFFTRREGANDIARAIYGWQPRSGRVRLVRRDASVDILAGCSFAGSYALCISEAPDRPRYLARIDLASGAERVVLDPNPWFAGRRHGPIRRLEQINRWGQRSFAYLVLPPEHREGQRHPLVVTTYRARGFLRGGVGDEYPIFAFAEQGLAVLAMDRPEEFALLERLEDVAAIEAGEAFQMRERRATLDSIELAIDELRRRGLVDPRRIAITGLSDGMETVNFAISHSSSFAAAISSGGGWEPSFAFLGPGSYFRRFGHDQTRFRDTGFITDQSLAMRADLVCAPLLVNASDTEYFTAAEAYVQLRAHHRPVEMFVYPGEYHIKWQPAHRLAVYDRNIDWLNFWLRGMVPARQTADVAAAWEAMRRDAAGARCPILPQR